MNNKKKGISEIIEEILLLLITIALAGSIYMYVSGVFTGRTAKTISVLDTSCTDGKITIVLSNEGTSRIVDDDIRVLIDNIDVTQEFQDLDPIDPHQVNIDTGTSIHTGSTTVLIVSPSNHVRQTVSC